MGIGDWLEMNEQIPAIVFGSVIAGVLLTLLVQAWLFTVWFCALPTVSPDEHRAQYTPFKLPKELKNASDSPDSCKPEDFLSMNILLQFIFQESKDTRSFRNWIMDRVHVEFEDLLKSNAGKMLNHLSVRDMNIGSELPMLQHVRLVKVEMKSNRLETLVLQSEMKYGGRFQLGVNIGSVLGRAFFAIVVSKLIGTIQIKLTREPFTHWSVAFTKDPIMEFEVESQYLGRQFGKITTLITNLFRRMVRKKHTLPNYKIRYKPFFVVPKPRRPDRIETIVDGKSIIKGNLDVKLLEITRLKEADCELYCLISLDENEWDEKSALPPAACQPNCELIKNKSEIKTIHVEENSEYININVTSSPSKNSIAPHAGSAAPTGSGTTRPSPTRERSSFGYLPDFFEEEDNGKTELENEIEKIINDKELCGNYVTEIDKESESEIEYTTAELIKIQTCKCSRTRKTNFFKPTRDITFNQRFRYDNLTIREKFVNITIVRYVAASKDKVGRILIKEQHIPMAYVSLSLNDIATQCLTTKQGDTVQCIQLNVAPGVVKTTSVKKSSYVDLESRKGFDESLCHGDIRILFKHTPSMSRSPETSPLKYPRQSYSSEMINLEEFSDTKSVERFDIPTKMHVFQRTSFHNVTYCKFCHKKIWLKTAFQCQKCLMVCHKKCTERCMHDTLCVNTLKTTKPTNPSVMSTYPETKLNSRGSYKNLVPNLNRLKKRNSLTSHNNKISGLECNLSNEQKMKRKSLISVSDLCATAAKEMGKDLFIGMEPDAREVKLNEMITQVKEEIVKESLNRDQSGGDISGSVTNCSIDSSCDERIETLNLLMLHYCSGLNHCLQQSANNQLKKTSSNAECSENNEKTETKLPNQNE